MCGNNRDAGFLRVCAVDSLIGGVMSEMRGRLMKSMRLCRRRHSLMRCRGDRIRTCDHLVPNQVRYRTALRPDATVSGTTAGVVDAGF